MVADGPLTTRSCSTLSSPKDSPWQMLLSMQMRKSKKLRLLLSSKVLLLEKRKLNSNPSPRQSKISTDLSSNSKTAVQLAATHLFPNTLTLLADSSQTLSLFVSENQPESSETSRDQAMISTDSSASSENEMLKSNSSRQDSLTLKRNQFPETSQELILKEPSLPSEPRTTLFPDKLTNKTQSSQVGGTADAKVRELELKLKTSSSRIQELESQNRSLELQLKQIRESKDVTSSANTSRVDTNLASSQYSSSSSSNRYGADGATYGSTSGNEPSYGGIAGTATTTSTYQATNRATTTPVTGATGTTSTSGAYGSYGTTSGTGAGYGTLSGSRTGTGAPTTTTTSGSSGVTGTSAYGTLSGSRTGTGATTTTTTTTTSGSSGVTGTSAYGSGSGARVGGATTGGVTGVTGTYGATGASYSSSGLGSSGAGNSSSSSSSYNFQTKRY